MRVFRGIFFLHTSRMAEDLKVADDLSSVKNGKNDYDSDPRTPCKYGNNCYQKNLKHHKRYKHPKRKAEDGQKEKKRPRLENSNNSPESKCIETDVKTFPIDEKDNGSEEKDDKLDEKDKFEEEEDGVDEDRLSPVNDDDYILEKFLVKMPEDFYSFWKFCRKQNPAKTEDALKLLNMKLVGPFDVLTGKLRHLNKKSSDYLKHWRYFYDPPEFQTVIAGDADTQFHIGYFRDDPTEMPAFVASNKASENCKLQILAPNLFSGLNSYISSLLKQSKQTVLKNFNIEKIKSFQLQLQKWAKDENISLDSTSANLKARSKKILMKTFHGAGLLVPYDDKTEVGYRPLTETDANLKKIFQKIVNSKTEQEKIKNYDVLQEIITLVQFANDECDYGMGLELGMDLFLFGSSELHSVILNILPLAYELLNRPQYSQIIKAHLRDRNKSKPFNILEEN